jgi:hypothetical protein
MAYCRWSSMNWRCDVYTYEDVMGGWTTHVAGNRAIFPPIPELPFTWLPDLQGEWDREARRMRYPNRWRALVAAVVNRVWMWSHRLNSWSLGLIPRRAIGLPFDGESFNDPTPGECAERLEWLRGLGYKVPQYAIDALKAEEDGAKLVPAPAGPAKGAH